MGNDALDRAREAIAARKAAGIKTVVKDPLQRLADLPTSLRRAVTARCWQCEGNEDPGVKWRIGNCLVTDCALHAVRPYQAQQGRPMPKVLT